MKTINNIFAVIACATLAASCSIKISVCDPESQTFTAGIEKTTQKVKAVVSGVKTYWEKGDAIVLYSGTAEGAIYSSSIQENSLSAAFSGTGAVQFGDDNVYMAFYPAGAINTEKGWTTGYLYYKIPEQQVAVTNGFPENTIVMSAKSSDESFTFHHVNAYLKFTVDASSPAIKSIGITDNNGSKISGDMRLVNGTMAQQVNSLSSAVTYPHVLLKSSNGEALPVGDYYVALRARDYSAGLTFCFQQPDGKVSVKKIDEAISLTSGQVAIMGTIQNLSFKGVDELLGSAYTKGNDKGIVFEVNSDYGNAKIISAWEKKEPWRSPKLADQDAGLIKAVYNNSKDWDDGEVSQALLMADETINAAGGSWGFQECAKAENGFADGGWYLPTGYELLDVLRAYYGFTASTLSLDNPTAYNEIKSAKDFSGSVNADRKAAFDASATTLGCDPLDYSGASGYWAINATSTGKIYWVVFAPTAIKNGSSNSTSQCYVRCVKKVIL